MQDDMLKLEIERLRAIESAAHALLNECSGDRMDKIAALRRALSVPAVKEVS